MILSMKTSLLSLMRKLAILLFVGLLVSVYSGVVENTTWKAFAHIHAESDSKTQQVEQLDFHTSISTTTIPATNSNQVQLDRSLNDGLWYAPTVNQRCISMSGFSFEDDYPEYLLATEILLPDVPELCHGYAVALPDSPWTLFHPGRGRLNGWKESNLQYRFIHHI